MLGAAWLETRGERESGRGFLLVVVSHDGSASLRGSAQPSDPVGVCRDHTLASGVMYATSLLLGVLPTGRPAAAQRS